MAARNPQDRVKLIAPTVPFGLFLSLLALALFAAWVLHWHAPRRLPSPPPIQAAKPTSVSKTPLSPPSRLFVVKRERPRRFATVLSHLALAPVAGNGIQPVCAAYDTRRNRLYVLNNLTQNLSVVDLVRHQVADVWQVPPVWDALNHHVELYYDPNADRLFLVGDDIQRPSAILNPLCSVLAISPMDGRVLGRCTIAMEKASFQNAHHPVTFNPERGELYMAVRGDDNSEDDIAILDTRTLRIKRRFTVPSGIRALAIGTKTEKLYTLESCPLPSSNGSPVYDNDTHRLMARSLHNGRLLARCTLTFDHPIRLILDEPRNRIILLHSANEQKNEFYSEISLLDSRTLKVRRNLILSENDPDQFAASSLGIYPPAIKDILFDATHNHLIAQTEALEPPELAVVNLKGNVRPRFIFLRHPLTSESKLAAVQSATGQILLLDNNGIFGMDIDRRHEAWRLPVGADIGQAFLDRQQHRLLADVQTDSCRLLWVQGRKPVALLASPPPSDPGSPLSQSGLLTLAGVDFLQEKIYTTSPSLSGPGAYLNRISFDGKVYRAFSFMNEGKLQFLAIGDLPGKRYHVEFPENTDIEEPKAYVDVYQDKTIVKEIPAGSLPTGLCARYVA